MFIRYLCVFFLSTSFFCFALEDQSGEKVVSLDRVIAVQGLPAIKATNHRDAVLANLVQQHLYKKLPAEGDTFSTFGNTLTFKAGSVAESVSGLSEKGEMALMLAHLEVDRFVEGALEVTWPGSVSLFLNGEKVAGTAAEGVHTFSTKLINASHKVFLILEKGEESGTAAVSLKLKSADAKASFDIEPMRRARMEDFYYLENINELSISPYGQYLACDTRFFDEVKAEWSRSVVIWERTSKQVMLQWHGNFPENITFTDDDRVIYTLDGKIWSQSLEGSAPQAVLEIAEDVENFHLVHNGSALLFEWYHTETARKDGVKRYRGLEDRWSFFRRRAQVFQLDLTSGLAQQLTELPFGATIHDVAGDRVLLATTLQDYEEPPYMPTQLYELSLADGSLKKVVKAQFIQAARFAPDGYYVLAGPNAFEGKGRTTEEVGNEYDTQLFLLDSEGKHTKSLSREFDPAIGSIFKLPKGDLLLTATDTATNGLFLYNAASGEYTKLEDQSDTIYDVTVSAGERPVVAFEGANLTRSGTIFTMDLGTGNAKPLLAPGQYRFEDVHFGNVREYMVRTEQGTEVPGRIYLPPNFDANKKYPTIVYYYGGVVPVGRNFTGRYPFHMWAAQGYVIYVVQPTGTVGWGQEKSSKHVNAWGRYTADDIIDATRAYLAEHSFADANRVGCMGASYGGFMTMYLQTRTDLFSAAVSHAGISDLTGYWGYGWWGYLYSGVATRDSFPWNAKELYTEQSPVYAADKVKTPILLITGNSDTNVPASQSHIMYTALKLLGKDVDLVEVEGEDHHINDPLKRMIWWNTISAYFDRHLKQQPQWWESIYTD